MEKIIYDSHMHTPMSKHAKGWPIDYAKVAIEKNFKGICFTDHAPMQESFINSHTDGNKYNIDLRVFEEYFSLIEFTKRYYEGQLDIRIGAEVDFIPTDVEHVEKIISMTSFDYILGSVHCSKRGIVEDFYNIPCSDGQNLYYKQLTDAAKSGLFDCITHPDLVKLLYPIENWQPEKLQNVIDEFLDALNSTSTCLELNTSGLIYSCHEIFPCDYILERAYLKKVPIVVGSDAHVPDRVGADFKEALQKLLKIGYKEAYYYLQRQRQSYSIEEALKTF